jgi:hypothetical protein
MFARASSSAMSWSCRESPRSAATLGSTVPSAATTGRTGDCEAVSPATKFRIVSERSASSASCWRKK